MIMLVRPVDPEGDHDFIEKRHVGKRHATGTKIGASMEHKLVSPPTEISAFEKRRVNPAVIIRRHRGDETARPVRDPVEVDPQPGGRTACSGVENMRCEPAHDRVPFFRSTLSKSREECQLNIEDANKFDQDSSLENNEFHPDSGQITMPDHQFTIPPDSLKETEFMTQFGGIYEHSPWVAESIWDQGLGPDDRQLAHFAARMREIVDGAGPGRQLALLRAHPELAGRLAIAGALTAESSSEQAGAGLDRCTPDEFARFSELNDRYGARFGHPFIIAVRGLERTDILAAFAARIGNDPATEFTTALSEVHKIARLRLELLCG